MALSDSDLVAAANAAFPDAASLTLALQQMAAVKAAGFPDVPTFQLTLVRANLQMEIIAAQTKIINLQAAQTVANSATQTAIQAQQASINTLQGQLAATVS